MASWRLGGFGIFKSNFRADPTYPSELNQAMMGELGVGIGLLANHDLFGAYRSK